MSMADPLRSAMFFLWQFSNSLHDSAESQPVNVVRKKELLLKLDGIPNIWIYWRMVFFSTAVKESGSAEM